jgi:uncharacterized protein (TIGR03435 family)
MQKVVVWVRAAALGSALLVSSFAQPPAAAPAFDVASIKPSEPITQATIAAGRLHAGMKIDSARVDIGNFPLMQLICKAYDVKPYQVQGPPWLMSGQRFDIVANMPPGATREQVPQMLQMLLAERFKLVIRRDSKEQTVYGLVVGKGGIKMKESEEIKPAEGEAPNPAVTGSSSVTINQTQGGAVVSDGSGRKQKMSMAPDGKSMRLEASGITLAELAEGLSPMTDHPVIDMTGLKGKYDVTLDISMQDLMAAARAAGAAVPGAPAGGDPGKPADAASDPGGSIFNAIQTLGLKLEPRKSAMVTIVVEHVEKMPTEN